MRNAHIMASSSRVGLIPAALGLASPAAQNNLSPFAATTATPSPYANFFTSGANLWSSRSSVDLRHLSLSLRALAFFLCFASSLSLAVPPPQAAAGGRHREFSFFHYPAFRYCISVTIIASIYLGLQLFRGIWGIAFRGFIVSEKVSDYVTFFMDQVVAYLLMSSSSVSLLSTQDHAQNKLRAAAIVSTVFSFCAFVAVAVSALLAGYRLCKRLIW